MTQWSYILYMFYSVSSQMAVYLLLGSGVHSDRFMELGLETVDFL